MMKISRKFRQFCSSEICGDNAQGYVKICEISTKKVCMHGPFRHHHPLGSIPSISSGQVRVRPWPWEFLRRRGRGWKPPRPEVFRRPPTRRPRRPAGATKRRPRTPASTRRSRSTIKLEGSIGEGSNHSNFSHQSSVKILSE